VKKSIAISLLVLAGALAGWTDTQPVARVQADNVNLRAKPSLRSETVGQADFGAELKVRSLEPEWVEVVPPEDIDFWIHGDFIRNDRVSVSKLNVRSGPGINYSVVGSLGRNEAIDRRGNFGEWVKIAAPPDGSIWVSRDLVDVVYPAPPVPPPAAAPGIPVAKPARPEPAPPQPAKPEPPEPIEFATDPAPVTVPPGRPDDLDLVPLAGQGRLVRKMGELKKSNYLFVKAPGSHRLIERNRNSIDTRAYVRGNVKQLNALVGRRIVVQGREYWIEGEDVPLIMIELIEMLPDS
jgi:SH3 domain protein